MARIHYQHMELSWRKPFLGKPRLHRLGVKDGFPTSPIAERIYQQFGLGYFICHHFPRILETEFPVLPAMRQLIEDMYCYYGKKPPEWRHPVFRDKKRLVSGSLNPGKVVVTLSGGKDGLYYLLRCIERYGNQNVLPVHISHLSMEGVSHRELKAARNLADRLGAKLKIIELVNSTRIPGPRIMNFRDIFLPAMLAAMAHEFGASKIFMEGSDDAKESGDPYFSDLDTSQHALRDMLHEWGLAVEVVSEKISEYEVLRRMFANPRWATLMPHTHSCLRCDRLMMFCRRWHAEHFPELFKRFYEGQCGSCFKCRVITLSRILWDPIMEQVPFKECKEYLARTNEWREKLKRKHRCSWDFVNDPSLLKFISAVGCRLAGEERGEQAQS